MADSRLLVGMILSLLLSSTIIALMVGGTAAELGDYQLYEPIDVDLGDLNQSVWYEVEKLSLGSWVRTSEGLVSDSPYTNLVYFVSIWPKDGLYVNEYIIDNYDNRPYTLIVRQSGFFFDSVEVYVEYGTGISIRSNALLGYRPYERWYPVNVPDGVYTIRTELDEETTTVRVYINGALVAEANDIPTPFITSWQKRQYSGIEVVGEGFVLKGIKSSGKGIEEESFSIWSFFGSLAGVLGWYTDPSGNYLADMFINLIIKVQQLGIIVFIVTLIRGN
jgi:hypothetical protein